MTLTSTPVHEHLGWWFSETTSPVLSLSLIVSGQVRTAFVDSVDEAADQINLAWVDSGDIYVRQTTLTERPAKGRGGAELTAEVPGMWLDVDVAGPGHETPLRLPEDEGRARYLMALLPEPSAIVSSGGGYYPLWKFESPMPGSQGTAEILRHMHNAAALVFAGVGARDGEPYHLDNVTDLARILRPVGTVNTKYPDTTVHFVRSPSGVEYDPADLAIKFADAASIFVQERQAALSIDDVQVARPKTDNPTVIDTFEEQMTLADVLHEHHGIWSPAGMIEGMEAWRRDGTTSHYSLKQSPTGVIVVWSATLAAQLGIQPGAGLTLWAFTCRLYGHEPGRVASEALKAARAGQSMIGVPNSIAYAVETVARSTAPGLSPVRPGVVTDEPADAVSAASNITSAGSWDWADLTPYLAGMVDEEPTLLPRLDGRCLLYRGRLHWFAGEPESGKTWLALLAVVDTIERGGNAWFLDFEDSPAAIVNKLVALGLDPDAIAQRFRYTSPEDPVVTTDGQPTAVGLAYAASLPERVADCPPELIVIDGVTESLAVHNLDSDNKSVAVWVNGLVRSIQHTTRAAMVVIDHVTKSSEGRGRWAIGGGHKMAATDVSLSVELQRPLSRATPADTEGRTGEVLISLGKDRPGHLRSYQEHQQRGQPVARLLMTSWPDGKLTWALTEPGGDDDGARALMGELLGYLTLYEGATITHLAAALDDWAENVVRRTITRMVDLGLVAVEAKGNTFRHSITPQGLAWLDG